MALPWRWAKQELGWTWPHLQNLCGYAFFQAICGLLSKDAPASLRSREALLQALRSAPSPAGVVSLRQGCLPHMPGLSVSYHSDRAACRIC